MDPQLVRRLAALVAPPRCAICAAPCAVASALCAACRRDLDEGPGMTAVVPGLEVTWSALPYEGTARGLVAALKLRGRLALAAEAAALIARRAPGGVLSGCLVPVPPAARRLRRRGFDPAGEIADALGREVGLPVGRCLRRAEGPRQVGRSRAQRLAEPPQVEARAAPPPRAVLVDDVTTTGATLTACALALRDRGAESVFAVTFARTVASAPGSTHSY